MKQACIVIGDKFFQNNRLFDLDDPIANRDNCLYPFALLQQALLEKGYQLATADIITPETADLVIYVEMPKELPTVREKSYLILFESELIRPDNWDLTKHRFFNKVFTWHDELVGTENYIKSNFSQKIESTIDKGVSHKNKLCTLIAGNKTVQHPLELYSKRVAAIRWFEKNHPEDFDLYGVGWDSFHFSGPKLIRALNRIKPLTKLLAPKFPSYLGKVDQKKVTLEQYKFAICYENARDIPGYITEKIFDCLFAGCIPVYWGANNITDYVPKECFIDQRQFDSYEQLYDYLQKMSDQEYLQRLDAIEAYLNSKQIDEFSAEKFVETIVSNVVT